MKVYLATIWNKSKLQDLTNSRQQMGESDYDYLIRVEEQEMVGVSSIFPVLSQEHLDDIVEAIHNETDQVMSFHLATSKSKFDTKSYEVIEG